MYEMASDLSIPTVITYLMGKMSCTKQGSVVMIPSVGCLVTMKDILDL